MRFSRMGWASVAALAIVVMAAQVATAQREEGRRGGRGGGRGFGPGGGGGVISALQLASNDDVQKALKVSDEQKDKITELNAEQREEFGKLRDEARDSDGGFEGMREKMQQLNASMSKKLNEILDSTQQKRLMGIQVQLAGPSAIMDPAISKELGVTDDQKAKLQEVSQSNREAMRELFDGQRDQDGDREAMREKREQLREEGNKKLMAVLTADQQSQLEALKGEKVDIDPATVFRGQGGGRFGDRQRGERGERGNRQRGERNRDRADRNPESNN